MLPVTRSSRHRLVHRSCIRFLSTEKSESSSTSSEPPPPSSRPSPSKASFSPGPRPSPSSSHPHSSAEQRTFRYNSKFKLNKESTFKSVIPQLPAQFGANQRLRVPDETRALLEEIVAQFRAPIRYAFAYGSGVFAQSGYDGSSSKRPMLDFIFAVSHPDHWHAINMHQFPSHYPLHARLSGSSLVSRFQSISPGVWFNAYVPINGVTIKYGVTTVDNLCSDLLTWNTLYLSGRMHKPIRIIKDDPRVRLTQQVNLASAIRTALLTLPAEFTEAQLFETLASISYAGDPRMLLPAENRQKVQNIVSKQQPHFRELYHQLVNGLPGVHWGAESSSIQQDISPKARSVHLRKLPLTLLRGVESHYLGRHADLVEVKETDDAAFWSKVAEDESVGNVVQSEMRDIVRGPAFVQSLKGIYTAGVTKSARYSLAKVGKWWKS
ncbi:Mitochondrial translocator assembly and maintenance protein 41 [Tulasnella sp. 418]|nr:Mitochondrial translocator assembly and maintenance protein 41 [Tulasnella sp. 418]